MKLDQPSRDRITFEVDYGNVDIIIRFIIQIIIRLIRFNNLFNLITLLVDYCNVERISLSPVQ